MNTGYYVYWISQRGFANEGDYVYGLEYFIDGETNGLEPGRYKYVSGHRTKDAAMRRATKEARKAIREYHAHDTVSIGIREAGKEATQEDYEAVKYNIQTT